MTSTKTLARTAGVLYLLVGLLGGFSEYVRTTVTVPGDAQATAASIVQHATLFRIGVVTGLVDFTCFLGVGLILYSILKPVDSRVAMAMLVINAISVAMQALNMLNQVGALMVATNQTYGSGMSSLLFLELHRHGYLVYRSAMFPKALGIVLMVGCGGYLMGVAATYLSSSLESSIAIYFGLIGGLAEVAFLLWLLIAGASAPKAQSSSLQEPPKGK